MFWHLSNVLEYYHRKRCLILLKLFIESLNFYGSCVLQINIPLPITMKKKFKKPPIYNFKGYCKFSIKC